MDTKDDGEKLSTVDYWDIVLKEAKLPRINKLKDYYISINFFDSILRGENKKTFMEIGAGSSGWLPFFAKQYGLKVSGLDYSDIGCRVAEQNLKILDINYDEIICEDIFKWNSPKKYDIIFSYGVVEHFEDQEKLLKIFYDHLMPNGIIITLIPNLLGVMGALSRKFVPDIYKIHKVITKEELFTSHVKAGFKNIKTDYAGTFSLAVIPWIRSKSLLFRENSIQQKFTLKVIGGMNLLLSSFFRITGMDIPSKNFSPYLISVMRKE